MIKKIWYTLPLAVVIAAGIYWANHSDSSILQTNAANHRHAPPVSTDRAEPTRADDEVAPNESTAAHPAREQVAKTVTLTLADIPHGELFQQLSRLTPIALERALTKLSDPRIPHQDFNSLRVVSDGTLFYACDIPPSMAETTPSAAAASTLTADTSATDSKVVAAAASATPPVRHSRPGSSRIIYLDFTGPTISGTLWNTDYNGGAAFTTLPYSADGDYESFTDEEQAVIVEVWERVSEDFRPFDVDVTTETPASMGANVVHVVITHSQRSDGGTNPEAASAGGVAFLDNFGPAYAAAFSPAFVYHNNTQGAGMADAISHEAGHYIGNLHHDGTSSSEYYGGHGSGSTSWGPIMGGAYGKKITQWSKGEYHLANNAEDDLALLASRLGFIPDDHSEIIGGASPLAVNGDTFSGSGIINTTNETDLFSITLGASNITIKLFPFPVVSSQFTPSGSNLDSMIELLDSAGNVVASDSPYNGITPSLSLSVAAGTYYLRVTPVGFGFPTSSITPSGYTTYGSIGLYNISGTIADSGPQLSPRFTTQPLNKILTTGSQSSFVAVASGTPDPSYQWQRMPVGTESWEPLISGGSYSGVNSSVLIITGATPSMNGDQFRCIASNSEGTIISGMAILTVLGGLSPIDTEPVSAEIYPGGNVYFEIEYHGRADIRWYHNGRLVKEYLNYANTTAFYVIRSASAADAGSYYVTATKDQVVYTSSTAELVVSSQAVPFISSHPGRRNISANLGSSATLDVEVSSISTPTYQWRLDGADIPGATGSSYTVDDITVPTAGPYDVVVSNSYGSSISQQYTIQLNPTNPAIYSQPRSATSFPGEVATFSVEAVGHPPLTYRWQGKSSADGEWFDLTEPSQYRGVNKPQLEVTTSLDLNAFAYRCVVSIYNHVSATSDAALLTVAEFAPLFTQQPASQSVMEGESATFVAAVTGGTISIRWQRMTPEGEWTNLSNNEIFSGVTTSSLVIATTAFTMHGDQYRVVATNEIDASYSDATVLTVGIPVPVITAQPANQYVRLGDTINLLVEASSQDEINYQWQKNGGDIEGATGNAYSITSAQASDVGSFRAVVSNSFGSVTSDTAEVVLAVAPSITTGPVSQTVYTNAPATFSVIAKSNAPLSYQWEKNGIDVSSATSATYTIGNTQIADAGDYTVTVTNIAGSDTSSVATLTVTPGTPPQFTQQPSDLNRLLGQSATLAITTTGTPAPTYQWQVQAEGSSTWSDLNNGSNVSGSQSETLTITGLQLANNGDQYHCIATNVAGSSISSAAIVSVRNAGIVKLSSGRYHSLRITTTGALSATGHNASGQLGDGTTTNTTTLQSLTIPDRTIADLSAGADHSYILTTNRELWATGSNAFGQLGDSTFVNKSTPILIATDVAGMSAGNAHSAILKTDGTLWMVGRNNFGQLGNGTTTDASTPVQIASGVADVATGLRHTLFLKADGTLWAMGDLLRTGTVSGTASLIATGVRAISASGFHSLYVKTDGTLWGLGYNANGQLGTGDTTERNNAVQIDTNVKTVSSGYFHSVYLKNDNSLWGTGSNGGGQLGDGTLTSRSTPYQMTTNVAAVSAGENNTLFTKYDGTLWATGYTANGQFGNGTTATVTTPVQLGSGVVLAPPPPADLTATSNDPYDRVSLTWSPDVNATSYEVWRSPTNDGASAILLASGLRWSFFEDLTTSLGQTYYYAVKASNPTGSSEFGDPTNVHTGAAIPLTITGQPQDASITVGQNHTFTVVATGTGTLTYQWRKNGTPITGATSASYTLSNASLGDAGSYEVVVTDDGGPTSSDEADLSVTTATATVTLGNLNAIYDGNPHAATATTDPSGLTVTFTYNGSPTEPTDAGDYTVVGTIDDASYTGSASDTLSIAQATQTITFASLADRGFTNSSITLSATADSGLPVSFAVQSGPATISGSALTLTGTGTITVRATQTGNTNYLAAANVDRSFKITDIAQYWAEDPSFHPIANTRNGIGRVNQKLSYPGGRLLIGTTHYIHEGSVTESWLVRLNSDGGVDPTFIPDGGSGVPLAVYPDGRILYRTLSSGVSGPYVRRMMADGSDDPTFTPASVNTSHLTAQILEDEKILLHGEFTTVGGMSRQYLARLNDNGSLDANFLFPADSAGLSDVRSVETTLDGQKLVVVGRNKAVRLNRDGSVDSSFSVSDGVLSNTLHKGFPTPDGGMIIAHGSLGLTRLTSTGDLDTGFSPSLVGSQRSYGPQQSDGKILYTTRVDDGGTYRQLRRVNLDGSDDSTFPVVSTPDEAEYVMTTPVLDESGGMFLGIVTEAQVTAKQPVLRILPDGNIDHDFAPRSLLFGRVDAHLRLPNGDRLVAGLFDAISDAALPNQYNLVRLEPDGTPHPLLSMDSWISNFKMQPDGRILVFGTFPIGSDTTARIIRLTAAGEPDATFSSITENIGNTAVDATGNIYSSFGSISPSLRRFHPNGQEDLSFNPPLIPTSEKFLTPLSDGSIVVAQRDNFENYTLLRLFNSGELDSNFHPQIASELRGTVALPDGSMLACSRQNTGDGSYHLILQRIRPSGEVDFIYRTKPVWANIGGLELQLTVGGVLLDLLREASPEDFATVRADFSDPEIGAFMECSTDGQLILTSPPSSNGQYSNVVRYLRVDESPPSFDATPFILYVHTPSSTLPINSSFGTFVIAGGLQPEYQWLKDGVPISGATSHGYSITGIQSSDMGEYSVQLTNSYGSVTSDPILLNIDTEHSLSIVITIQPVDQVVTSGSNVTFSVAVNANPTPTYQWYFGNTPISGAIDRSLTLYGVSSEQVGSYRVRISNFFTNSSGTYGGLIYSRNAILAIEHTIQSWTQTHFTTPELADSSISGPTADPDGDGITNLLEYALGLDPRSPDTTGLPEMSTTATDWVYTYTRPVDRSDITYEVEISSDLSSWSTTSVTHELLSTDSSTQTWQATVPLSAGESLYFHLKVVTQE